MFDYKYMINPYGGKDISFDFYRNKYVGEDKDYELPEDMKIKFSKKIEIKQKGDQKPIKILTDEERKDYYPKGLTCY